MSLTLQAAVGQADEQSMAGTTCPTCGALRSGRDCTECGAVSSRGRGPLGAARHGWVRYGVVTAPVMAVVMLAVVVFAGLAGFAGVQLTHAVFTNTKTVTGNTLGTAILQPPTALVVTANAGTLVLTWGATSSAYADGYYVYRAAASGGPYGAALATVAGRATTTWTDTTPPAGTSYYKMTAYRYSWYSADTAESSGVPFVLSGTLTGTTVPASWTAVAGATSYTLNRVATTRTAAQFNLPDGFAVGADGTMYVADTGNHRIRKVTAAGVVTTLAGQATAGFAEGTGDAAQFNSPRGVAVDGSGTVYVADYGNHRIRAVTAAGVVTTLAGSTQGSTDATGAVARFNYPAGIAIDGSGVLYVADTSNHRIRKVTAAGVVTTLAGSTPGFAEGTGAAAQFSLPLGVTVAADGTVYVGDSANNRIRKVTAGGVVTTLAGQATAGSTDGTGAAAQFFNPTGVAVAADGTVYVTDYSNHRVRKVTAGGVVTTLAGSTPGFADGPGTGGQFRQPNGIAVDGSGLYVADTWNNRIRKVTAAGVVTTLAGSTSGFVETGAPADVPSVVYSGSALNYTDTALTPGTSYTYTATAVGPGTVSNTIGPFVPTAAGWASDYYASGLFTVPAGVTSVHLVAKGSIDGSLTWSGGIATGDMAVTPGQVLDIRVTHPSDGQDSYNAEVYTYPIENSVMTGSGGHGFGEDPGWAYANPTYLTPWSVQTGGWLGAATVRVSYTAP